MDFEYTPPADSAGKKVCTYAEDAAGNSHAELWSTAIAAPNVAPAFTSAETFSVAENQTAVGTVAAADANAGDSVAYAVTGGADAAKFAIVAGTGVLTFAAAPDFEDPQDAASTNPSNAAANNEYVLVVTATGGTGARAMTAAQTIVVTVTNVDEDGSVTFGSTTPRVGEALTASVEDPDGGVTSVTWQWAKSSTKSGTYADISGATSASYTPAADDEDAWLRATAGYTDAEGSGKSAAAVAAAAVADTAAPTVEAASTGYYGEAGATTALTGAQKAGADIYTKVTFSEDIKHVKSDAAAALGRLPALPAHRGPRTRITTSWTAATRWRAGTASRRTLKSHQGRDYTTATRWRPRTSGNLHGEGGDVQRGRGWGDGDTVSAAAERTPRRSTRHHGADGDRRPRPGTTATRALSNALAGPLKSGTDIYTKVTFSEDMKHVKSDAAAARPELFLRIGSRPTRSTTSWTAATRWRAGTAGRRTRRAPTSTSAATRWARRTTARSR